MPLQSKTDWSFCLMQKSMPFVATTSINHIETLVFFQENSFKHFSSDQSLGHVQLFVTPWTAARQASLSITNSQSLLELMSIESVMPSNHLILCLLLLPPSIFPSIRAFSNELVLCIRWPKYWSFSFSISPSIEYSGLISFGWTGWISLQSMGLSRVSSNTTVQKRQFFGAQLSLLFNSPRLLSLTGELVFDSSVRGHIDVCYSGA